MKPSKCVYHLVLFDWKSDGSWRYAANENNPEFDITVPMPDDSLVPSEHMSVDTANKTLGVKTCPSGAWKENKFVARHKNG